MSIATVVNHNRRRATRKQWKLKPTLCKGQINGEPCGKVLAFGLLGRVHLQCSRCRYADWYNFGVDNPEKITHN